MKKSEIKYPSGVELKTRAAELESALHGFKKLPDGSLEKSIGDAEKAPESILENQQELQQPSAVSFQGAESRGAEIIDSNDLDPKTERSRYADAMKYFLGIPIWGPNCKDYAYGITRDLDGNLLRHMSYPGDLVGVDGHQEMDQAMVSRNIPRIRSTFEKYIRLDLDALGKELVPVDSNDYIPKEGERMIAMATAPRSVYDMEPDFHFYVKGSDGLWSHKPSNLKVTDKVGLFQKIEDPATCDYGLYVDFAGYYVIRDKKEATKSMQTKPEIRNSDISSLKPEQDVSVFDSFQTEFHGSVDEKMDYTTNLLERYLNQQEISAANEPVRAEVVPAQEEKVILDKLSKIIEVIKTDLSDENAARFSDEDLYSHSSGLIKTEANRKSGPGTMAYVYDAPTFPNGERYSRTLRLGEFDPGHSPLSTEEMNFAMLSGDKMTIKSTFEPHMRSDLAYLGKELTVAPSPDYVPQEGERMVCLAVTPNYYHPLLTSSPTMRFFVRSEDGGWSYKEGLGNPVSKSHMDLYADYLNFSVVEYYLIRDKSMPE